MNSLNQWYQSTDSSEKYQISQDIDNYLKGATNYLTDANVVAFYFEDGGFYYYGKVPAVGEQAIREAPWYQETLENNHKVHLIDSPASISGAGGSKTYISAAIHPQNTMNNAVEMILHRNHFGAIQREIAHTPYEIPSHCQGKGLKRSKNRPSNDVIHTPLGGLAIVKLTII